MYWIVGDRRQRIWVTEEFANECGTYAMFFDGESEFECPLDIADEIQRLVAVRSEDISFDQFETPDLVQQVHAADYLANERAATRLGREIAERLAGKTPRAMAEEIGVEYEPDATREAAFGTWLIPKHRVRPWDETGHNWK